MPTFFHLLDAAARACDRAARFLLVILSVGMAAAVFLHIGLRYFVDIPLLWLEELARYLLIWIAMMGAPVALAEGKHFGVAYLMDGLSRRYRGAAMTVAILGILGFLYLFVRAGSNLALAGWSQHSTVMMVPMFFPYLAIPVGGGMMIIMVLKGLVQLMIAERRGRAGAGGRGPC